jgi:hypothetical protein
MKVPKIPDILEISKTELLKIPSYQIIEIFIGTKSLNGRE